jgi:hypothetical protein
MANIYNSLRTSVNLQTYVPVTDQMDQDADLSFQATRHVPNVQVTLVPGLNTVDATFWSNWLASNPASALPTTHTIFPA